MIAHTLMDSTPGKLFLQAARIQQSVLAEPEKRLLIWMAERMPSWIHPDQLTIFGFLAQLMTGVSYAIARSSQLGLTGAIVFLILNWLGDSMDGTLARVRQQQRPRYGFYVDHMLDSIGAVALMAGLGWSEYMSPKIAIVLLVLFLLLSIQSYLATYSLGEFRMSFWSFGPTELRLLLILGNLAVFHWPTVLLGYRLFDVGGVIGIAGMAAMLIWFTGRNVARLYKEERVSWGGTLQTQGMFRVCACQGLREYLARRLQARDGDSEIGHDLARCFRTRAHAIGDTDSTVRISCQRQTRRRRNDLSDAFHTAFVTEAVLRHRSRPLVDFDELRLSCDAKNLLELAPNHVDDLGVRQLQYLRIAASTQKTANQRLILRRAIGKFTVDESAGEDALAFCPRH